MAAVTSNLCSRSSSWPHWSRSIPDICGNGSCTKYWQFDGPTKHSPSTLHQEQDRTAELK